MAILGRQRAVRPDRLALLQPVVQDRQNLLLLIGAQIETLAEQTDLTGWIGFMPLTLSSLLLRLWCIPRLTGDRQCNREAGPEKGGKC